MWEHWKSAPPILQSRELNQHSNETKIGDQMPVAGMIP